MARASQGLACLCTLAAWPFWRLSSRCRRIQCSPTNTTRCGMSRRLPDADTGVDLIVKLRSEIQPPRSPSFPRPRIARRPWPSAPASTLELRRQISDTMLAEPRGAWPAPAASRSSSDCAQIPQVEYVALDRRRYPHATNPNDALFGGQWYLQCHRGVGSQCHQRLGRGPGYERCHRGGARYRRALRPSGPGSRRPRWQAASGIRLRDRNCSGQ